MKRANGEGTLYPIYLKDKNKNIVYDKNNKPKVKIWAMQITINGKRKAVYAKKQSELITKVHKLQSAVITQTYCEKNKVTIGLLGKQIQDRKLSANLISECTYLRNMQTFKSCSYLWPFEVQEINTEILQNFFNSCVKYSNSYIEKIHICLNQIFNYAVSLKIISQNPLQFILKPKSLKPNKEVVAFTIEQQKQIINALQNEKYKNIFLIGFNTGMRIGEILALTPQDIDFKNMIIKITNTISKDKNGNNIVGKTTKTYESMRTIPLTINLQPVFKEVLTNYIPNENNLLFTNNGKILDHSTLNSQLKRICKNLNINVKPRLIVRGAKKINSSTSNVNFHMLRHTYATRCIESGMPAVVLSRLLGHKNISITLNTYTSVFNKFKIDALDQYQQYMQTILN